MKEREYLNSYVYYVDEFFPIHFVKDLSNKVLRDRWTMHTSTDDDKSFFWNLNIEEPFYKDELNFIKSYFPENQILRVYVNGQSGIQHGNFHMDDGNETFLIGMTENWDSESGGATEFYDPDAEDWTYSIYPKFNRLICFPANIKHRALPNIDLDRFRMTLAVKTVRKQEDTVNNSQVQHVEQPKNVESDESLNVILSNKNLNFIL